MAFITRFFARLVSTFSLAILVIFLIASAPARAGGIDPQKAVAVFSNDRIEIAARFQVNLTPALELALQNGLSLPFKFEFQLTRPRLRAWALQLSDWFEPAASLTQRLSYQPLTRQYRVLTGGVSHISRSFNSLNEALAAVGVIGSWQVLPDSSLAHDSENFAGRLRLRLDLSQLPKPYQLAALGNSDWHLDSPWADLSVHDLSEAAQP